MEQPPAATEKTVTAALPWDIKTRFRRKYRFQASRSYWLLSLCMGVVATALPFLLLAIEGLEGSDGTRDHYSISHFYYSVNPRGRDVLVGSLCAVSIFLLLFQGLSKVEARLLNLAGIAALGVAFFPMGKCQGATCPPVPAHYISAGVFFACISIVAIFYSKQRVEHIVWPPLKHRLIAAYTACGIGMIVLPTAVGILHILRPSERNFGIFWTESAGIWAFAAFWFVKTWEYRKLLGIR